MGRLIDADLLLENYNLKNADKRNPEGCDTLMKYEVKDMIEDAPSVDAVPVVYGEWTRQRTLMHDGELWCTNCGKDNPVDERLKFCPNCGAKMDGKEQK